MQVQVAIVGGGVGGTLIANRLRRHIDRSVGENLFRRRAFDARELRLDAALEIGGDLRPVRPLVACRQQEQSAEAERQGDSATPGRSVECHVQIPGCQMSDVR